MVEAFLIHIHFYSVIKEKIEFYIGNALTYLNYLFQISSTSTIQFVNLCLISSNFVYE